MNFSRGLPFCLWGDTLPDLQSDLLAGRHMYGDTRSFPPSKTAQNDCFKTWGNIILLPGHFCFKISIFKNLYLIYFQIYYISRNTVGQRTLSEAQGWPLSGAGGEAWGPGPPEADLSLHRKNVFWLCKQISLGAWEGKSRKVYLSLSSVCKPEEKGEIGQSISLFLLMKKNKHHD